MGVQEEKYGGAARSIQY